MPNTPRKIWSQLGIKDENLGTWESVLKWGNLQPGIKVSRGQPIFPRIEENGDSKTDVLQKQDRNNEKSSEGNKGRTIKRENNGNADYITIDDFAKLDLRVADVLKAERIEGADKLLKLELDVGGEKRQVVSGIAQFYSPEDLEGKKVVLVANLKPVKLRGVESQGMILAASDKGDKRLAVLTIDRDLPSGLKVT
jgi:methionyl-tRNA synthetase